MSKKLVLVLLIWILLSALICLKFDIAADVEASNGYPVHNLDTGLNYTSVQEAINAPETLTGHTIFVESKTYYGHLVVNKSLSLIGENRGTTIIDGNGTGVVVDPLLGMTAIVHVVASNVNISRLTVRNGGTIGILLNQTAHCRLDDIDSFNSFSCVALMNSHDCRVTNSHFHNSTKDGLMLFNSTENEIINNMISENPYCGIGTGGPEGSSRNLIANNILSHNVYAGSNILGYGLDLVGSDNRVFYNNMSCNTNGIVLYHANRNQLKGNVISNNTNYGIWITYGLNNTFLGNTVQESGFLGLSWDDGPGNTFHHNNFVNNNYQVGYIWYVSDWDDGIEGNYWSDYTGKDSIKDGIGDDPYIIYEFGRDNHPLMGKFSTFNAIQDFYVNVISNSTIESFHYLELNNTIKMLASNMTVNQLFGFVRIRIPHTLMSEPYKVTVDGINPTFWNYTLYDDGENRWIYFSYQHSRLEIIIVPEFPSFLILPLFMLTTLLAVIVHKRKST